jgi:cell division protein FtsB
MDENSCSETRCKNPACGRLLTQAGGGHRKREYCDDACRQAARRHRKEQAHRDEVNRRWATFTAETRSFLDWLTTRYSYGKDLAYAVELAINREIDRYSAESSAQFEPALAALREKQLSRVEKLKARIHQLEQEAEKPQPRAVLSAEQARERARLHGYLDEGVYLASTQRLFVRVFQTGQVEPNEMREVIHQERGDAGQAKERTVALEQELADASQGRDQVQERFREYGLSVRN